MSRINPYKLFVGSFIPNWLLERPEVSHGAKLTYARLSQHAGEHCVAFPRQAVLAKEIGTSDRNVRNYLRELADLKLIEIEQPGLQKANRYYFLDHPWISPDRKNSSGPIRKDSSGPLKKRIILKESSLREDENNRIDRILNTPRKEHQIGDALAAAIALKFGRE